MAAGLVALAGWTTTGSTPAQLTPPAQPANPVPGRPAPDAVLPAQAQQTARVSASISPRVVAVGQEAILTLSVQGDRSIDELPGVEGLRIDGLEVIEKDSYQTTRITNGRISRIYTYTFSVIPEREGNFVIPPIEVVVDGQPLATPELRLSAREGAESRAETDPFVKIDTDKTELYVGEIVPVRVTLYVNRQTTLLRYNLPEIEQENLVIKRFDRPANDAVEINGQFYSVYTFESSLTAIRAGEFTLGPAALETMLAVSQNRNGFPSFFSQQVTKTFKLRSNSVSIAVLPLPEENRPESFTGAVGRFDMRVTAQPLQLSVGDPVAVDLAITGTGNFDAIEIPELTDPEGWRLYPASQTLENRTLGFQPGTVRFNQVIIPDRVLEAVPSFEFSFFDPGAKEYVTRRSAPIPLRMSPDPGARLPTETTHYAGAEGVAAAASTPEERMTDILHVITSPSAAWAEPVRRPLGSVLFWGAQAAPLALLVGMGVLAFRERKNRATREDIEAPEVRTPEGVLGEIERAESPAAFHRGVCELFELSGPPAPEAEDGALARLRARAEREAFGPEAGASAGPLGDAERSEVLRLLRRHLATVRPPSTSAPRPPR